MATTDRLSNLDSRREITDRFGRTVVLGNSILSGAIEITATFVAAAAGSATATSAVGMDVVASLTMHNGSFGLWTVDYDMDAAASMAWGTSEFHGVGFDMDSASTLIMGGAAVIDTQFEMAATSTLAFTSATVLYINASANLSWSAEGDASSLYEMDATALLAAQGTGLYPAAVTMAATASALWRGQQAVIVNFDLDAAATLAMATGVLHNGGLSTTPTAALTMDASSFSAGSMDATVIPKGYYAGGVTTVNQSRIDALSFTTETAAQLAATLSVARREMAGWSSPTVGYFAAGFISSTSNVVDGLNYSDETATGQVMVLTLATRSSAGVASALVGYIGGGQDSANADTDRIEGMTFSDTTNVAVSAVLSDARRMLASASSTTRGFFAGGRDPITDLIDGIQFSDESAFTTTAVLADGIRSVLSGVQSTTRCYFSGGSGGDWWYFIDGMVFATETAVNPVAQLATERLQHAGVSGTRKGYWAGGWDFSSRFNSIEGFQFTDETVTVQSATLSNTRYALVGVQTGHSAATSGLTMVGTAA